MCLFKDELKHAAAPQVEIELTLWRVCVQVLRLCVCVFVCAVQQCGPLCQHQSPMVAEKWHSIASEPSSL